MFLEGIGSCCDSRKRKTVRCTFPLAVGPIKSIRYSRSKSKAESGPMPIENKSEVDAHVIRAKNAQIGSVIIVNVL